MNRKLISTAIALLFVTSITKAQLQPAAVTSHDSLAGFDEAAAKRAAISEQFVGSELNRRLLYLKRSYINSKYNIKPALVKDGTIELLARTTAAPGCLNEDFEQTAPSSAFVSTMNQLSGWTVTRGNNDMVGNFGANSCNLSGCCPDNPVSSLFISAPNGWVDQTIGTQYPIYSVFGSGPANTQAATANPQLTGPLYGSQFLRLNNEVTGDYSIERLSKTFLVSSSNSHFTFAYLTCMSGAHLCCDAGAFRFRLTDASGNNLTCPSLSITVPTRGVTDTCQANSDTPDYFNTNSLATYTPGPTAFSTVYSRWKILSVDLTSYIGQTITVSFISADCDAGGHFSYAYVDAQCGPLAMKINGNTSVFASNTITLNSCEPTATVTAPSNFLSYQWSGPGGFTSNNQEIVTNVAGTYILALGQTALCQSQKTVVIQPFLAATSASLLCAGSEATLTASGLSSYMWNTGETTSSIIVSPVSTVTYVVSGTTGNGYACAQSLVENVVTCTGISSLTPGKPVMVYPNPNTGEFTITAEHEFKQAELLLENVIGQVVYRQPLLQAENHVSAKGLAPGIYYYTITENKTPVAKGKIEVE